MRVESALYYKRYAPSDGRPHREDQLVPIVFQPARIDEDYASMDDETYRSDMDCTAKEFIITQSAHCAENVFANQHRTHLFTILIAGRNARIMRWDHAGVVTSKAFDYVECWTRLCLILHRLTILAKDDPERLGIYN